MGIMSDFGHHNGMRSILVLITVLLSFALTGCTTSVTISGTVPTPLVQELPIHVGVYYSEEFKNYEYKELPDESEPPMTHYQVALGTHNLSFFRNLMNAMFMRVTELDNPNLTDAQKNELDVVLIPVIARYDVLLPAISTLVYHAVSIQYHIKLTDLESTDIVNWKIVGYGKAEGGVLGGGEAVAEATMEAIRDGGARIATEVPAAIKSILAVKEKSDVLEEPSNEPPNKP